jgi:hypothetical protein
MGENTNNIGKVSRIPEINELERTFNVMKGLGFYRDFKDYQEFHDKDKEKEPEKEEEKPYGFRETLLEEQKKEYDYMFGINQPIEEKPKKGRKIINQQKNK